MLAPRLRRALGLTIGKPSLLTQRVLHIIKKIYTSPKSRLPLGQYGIPITDLPITMARTSVAKPPPLARAITSVKIPEVEDMSPQLERIASSNRTQFEKRVWTALCQVPKGHVTTYAILAAHLKSSPRAVGNALRRNPFAPQVPCHRVVATGGALGGFKGKWPRNGEGITLDEKRSLLRKEGIKIDSGGRVLGSPFVAFV